MGPKVQNILKSLNEDNQIKVIEGYAVVIAGVAD
jgi:hypothetical protein